MPLTTAEAFDSTPAQKDTKSSANEAPEKQERVSETKVKQDDRAVEQEQKHEEEEEKAEEEEEEEEEEGPLSAAEEFAKSLTAVVTTTTLDPAATQLMDQLRLQEYLRIPTSHPTVTPPTTTTTTATTTTTTSLGSIKK
jgi:hypothetical protein